MTRRTFLISVMLLAFLLRAGAVIWLRDIHAPPNPRTTGADAVEYNLLGLHVAQGIGYGYTAGTPTSFRPPGFPFFLAVVYWFSQANYPLVYFLLCLMGAISCLLTYCIGRELAGERAARIAAVCGAIFIPYIYFATTFDSENLCSVLLALSIWLLIRHARTGSASTLVIAGLALGYCALVRPFSILLMLLLATALIIHQLRARRLMIHQLLLFATSFCVVILPWTLRNYRVHDHFVLIATNGGSTFYGGNNDIVSTQPRLLGAWVSPLHVPGRAAVEQNSTEYARDQADWRLGFQWVRSHWLRMPGLEACKFVRLWLPDIGSPNGKYVLLQCVGYTPFLLAFVIGAIRCAARWEYRTQAWTIIHLTVLATVLTGLIFWGSPRFRDVNSPILVLYAAVAIDAQIRRKVQVQEPTASESQAYRLAA